MEWQEELNKKRLKTRGWYGCIAPDGWKTIVEDVDRMLVYLDPDYEITQVKEKFGTLRYYYETTASREVQEIMDAVISYAEWLSARTCDVCGNSSCRSDSSKGIKWDATAVTKVRNGWYKTICDTCAGESNEFVSLETLVNRERLEDMELYAKKARQEVKDGEDILDVFLAIAKEDLSV